MIAPYRNPRPAFDVALVGGDGKVTLEGGARVKLADVGAGVVIYGDRDLVKDRFLTRGHGEAVCWNGTPIRWEHLGRSVLLLSGYPGDGDSVLAGLAAVRDYLHTHGAAIGSASSSSYSLLRATLVDPIRCNAGAPPTITEVMGGRQQSFVPPGHYGDFESWDLSAAYASSLGDLIYGGPWLPVDGEITMIDETPCIHHARVKTPVTALYGPLPRRKAKPEPTALGRRFDEREYPRGRMSGIFTADEVAAARAAGSTVKVDRSWVLTSTRRPFAPWWTAIQEARSLDGFAGTFAKQAGNALIGRFFATPGTRTRATWPQRNRVVHRPDPLVERPRFLQPVDAAEVVTSRVRARLLTELMLPAGPNLLTVHTDGGLVLPGGVGLDSMRSGWRLKERGSGLVYLAPSLYAYRSSTGRTTYKVAGVRPDMKAAVFTQLARRVFDVPVRETRAHVSEEDAWAAIVEVFGEQVNA